MVVIFVGGGNLARRLSTKRCYETFFTLAWKVEVRVQLEV